MQAINNSLRSLGYALAFISCFVFISAQAFEKKFTDKKGNEAYYVISKVEIKKGGTVKEYLKGKRDPDALKELWKGVTKIDNWSFQLDADGNVVSAEPSVDGHPGHIHNSDWKLNIERGNGSVDRLVLTKRKYEVKKTKKLYKKLPRYNVEISASSYVLEDTH